MEGTKTTIFYWTLPSSFKTSVRELDGSNGRCTIIERCAWRWREINNKSSFWIFTVIKSLMEGSTSKIVHSSPTYQNLWSSIQIMITEIKVMVKKCHLFVQVEKWNVIAVSEVFWPSAFRCKAEKERKCIQASSDMERFRFSPWWEMSNLLLQKTLCLNIMEVEY